MARIEFSDLRWRCLKGGDGQTIPSGFIGSTHNESVAGAE